MFVKTRPAPPAGIITAQVGPKFAKTTDQTGANLDDHTQSHLFVDARHGFFGFYRVVSAVKSTRRNVPIWISSPLASTAESTG